MKFDSTDLARLKHAGFDFESDKNGKSKTDDVLLISSHVVRAGSFRGMPTVLMQGPGDDALHAVVDGLHWVIHTLGLVEVFGSFRVAVRKNDAAAAVPDHTVAALARLAAVVGCELVQFELDDAGLRFSPIALPVKSPEADPRATDDWPDAVRGRQPKLPQSAQDLDKALNGSVPSFRWYQSVTGKIWSGRVAGWQVCEASGGSSDIIWRTQAADPADMLPVGAVLKQNILDFAKLRAKQDEDEGKHKLEHMLESAVLRGAIQVQPNAQGPTLKPLFAPSQVPFQFPTLYAHGGSARYVDALMRDCDTLWALELKVPTGGEGQYYRHALTQAVLYREFIRNAVAFHPWFQGLDQGQPALQPKFCQAAVVFPKLKSDRKTLLPMLQKTALHLGVRIVELDLTVDAMRTRAMA